jgi:predicted AAA+ superfamily ATPase
LELSKDPRRFHAQVLRHYQLKGPSLCVVDEIQKIPKLLDDIHDLIESTPMRFILTGSSARKLRRSGVNLLAGRVLPRKLFPMIVEEMGSDFDLDRALGVGMLPRVWNGELKTNEDVRDFLSAYCETYLTEEIQQEGLVRNIGPFSKFLDVAVANDGELVNFSNVARECGVSVKTAQEYYQILEDTLVAFRLNPWTKSARKRLVAHPKFTFFDPGVTNALQHLNPFSLSPRERGRRFEQFVILQAMALNEYGRHRLEFFYWRTNTGIEVHLLLCREGIPLVAAEFKSSSFTGKDCTGLLALRDDYPDLQTRIVVPKGRSFEIKDHVLVQSWTEFLQEFLPLTSSRE